MTTLSCASSPTVLELAAWCRLACDILGSAEGPSAAGERQLHQRHLLSVHRRHLAEWRRWLGERGMTADLASQRTPAWNEVKAAVHSCNPGVVQAAHALLRRALTTAYDRAAMRAGMDTDLLQRIQKQRRELSASYGALLRGQSIESAGIVCTDAPTVMQPLAS